jgi:hypothetical protein
MSSTIAQCMKCNKKWVNNWLHGAARGFKYKIQKKNDFNLLFIL